MASEAKRIVASTSVQLVIEVPASGNWQSSETIERIHREAATGAINRVRTMFLKNGADMKIVGEPRIISVLAEYER